MSKHSFNNKIEFNIEVVDNLKDYFVNFKVIKMDERFRAAKGKVLEYKCSNGFYVRSQYFPSLYLDQINLCGVNSEKDLDAVSHLFSNEQDAIEYEQKVIKALEDWSLNWTGWNEAKPVTEGDGLRASPESIIAENDVVNDSAGEEEDKELRCLLLKQEEEINQLKEENQRLKHFIEKKVDSPKINIY